MSHPVISADECIACGVCVDTCPAGVLELGDEHEAYDKPDFIGIEVTGDKRFYNSHLLSNPFALWRHTLPEEYQ